MNRILTGFILGLLTFFIVAPSVLAAKPVSSSPNNTPLGNDVSYPQCGKTLPKTHAFGIVGVNGGLATTTNLCLKDQLIWASKAIGGTAQEKIQLYVNTANPGGLNTTSWPTTGQNPYGVCNGSDSLACAWQYGWNRASEDISLRFQPAAAQAGINSSPSTYIWWLDVETVNTWKPPTSSFNTGSNTAVLEGMTAHFQSLNARVGLYSTAYQWGQIVGSSVSSTSNLNGLPNWRPGGANLKTAKQACTAAPLTTNGTVVLTQFVSKNLDYDYSCV
ncbi:MAG TPA: hypothetical protein VJJ78_03270 [Candidatus Saccharimonadales bacterium]|nr:hypothetical protein [Candidatus Saccharimonadales bacterium]